MSSPAFNEKTIQLIAENKLRQAIRSGEFDNLPGFGKPFEFDEMNYDPNWWIKNKLKREQLRVRGRELFGD